jgi:hypothetical protein
MKLQIIERRVERVIDAVKAEVTSFLDEPSSLAGL